MRHHSTSIVGPDIDDFDANLIDKETGQVYQKYTAPTLCSRVERIEEVVADMAQQVEALQRSDADPYPSNLLAPPAQPSVGENVMRAIHAASPWSNVELTQSLRDTMRPMALAVRREVLKEGFVEDDTEAAAKALWNATRPGITWDELREASRKPIKVQADAALSAALASRVARAEREAKQ